MPVQRGTGPLVTNGGATSWARTGYPMDRSMLAALPILLSLVLLPAASPEPGAPLGAHLPGALPPPSPTERGSSEELGLLSHLDAHLRARPPADLLQPLGDESLRTIVKGYSAERERALAQELLNANLHCRLLRVAVSSNGSLTAALVKLQAGDKQSELFVLSHVRQDVARVIRIAFRALPELGHLDVWAAVPWRRELEQVHRPVFTVSAPREKVEAVLDRFGRDEELLARCGGIRVEAKLLDYALDKRGAPEVLPVSLDVLAGPALDADWVGFGAGARSSGELDGLKLQGPVRAVLRGPATARSACLTIDDGPHPLMTPLVLDVLRRENVKATFFVVGEKVEQYPELARMIVRDGHELANHTYSHTHLSLLNPRGAWAQIRGCDVAVERACGVRGMRWFRPPGGDCSEQTLQVVEALGYSTVMWTTNTGDWHLTRPEPIAQNALRGLGPGGIILMHQDGLQSVQALEEIIHGVREAGLTLEPVGEMVDEESIAEVLPRVLLPLMHRAQIDL